MNHLVTAVVNRLRTLEASAICLRFFLLPAILALLACGGCVRSEQPLSPITEARADPRLVGQWHPTQKTPGEGLPRDLRVSYDEQGVGHIAGQTKPDGPWEASPIVSGFFVTTTPVASYLNCTVFDDDQKENLKPTLTHYEFYRYSVSGDGKTLTIQELKTAAFARAVKDGKLKGVVDPPNPDAEVERNVLLQDASAAILKFIESSPASEIFSDPLTATKVP